jgi:mannitol-1-phosphate/altronate dehydrogenase
VKIKGELPEALTLSMAYLINFYRSVEFEDSPSVKEFFATNPTVEAILGNQEFWGMDLNTIPGFTQKVKSGVLEK